MNKILLIPGIFVVMLFSACASTSSLPHDRISRDSGTDKDMTFSESSSPPSAVSLDSTKNEKKVVDIAVTNWSFSPSTITVHRGDKLVIRLKGVEGQHSFGMTQLGINVVVGPGETKDVEIPTDTAGSFEFRCLVPCGPGHDDMKGVLIVE